MSGDLPDEDPPHPRCRRCAAPLARAPITPGVFGPLEVPCAECSDGAPLRRVPWACRACGAVFLLDASARD